MTEKKIETLFNEAIIVGDLLEKNLQQFDKSHHSINHVYADIKKLTQTIEQISLYSQEIKEKEAQRFSDEIKIQVDRYHLALQEINLDTSAIETLIETYNTTVIKQIDTLEKSAHHISKTLKENGPAIIASAGILKRSKIGTMWSMTMFGIGTIVGALFLSAYPIAAVAKTFRHEIKINDEKLNLLKEQYETNDSTLAFLRKHDMTIRYNTTDDSWTKKDFRFSPMILLDQKQVLKVDEINGYTRIIFSKNKNKE